MAVAPALLALLLSAAAAPAAGAPAAGDSARADSLRAEPRVVRRFPAIEVRATVHDPRSSETVRMISGTAMRALPVDGFADVLALQPGVVAEGEELHVRGGRAGETTTFLDGICLNEPQWRHSMTLPLLALRNADLVSGSPEAQYGCGLAGAVDLRSVDPGPRPTFAWRWQTALEDRWFDRLSTRAGMPLPVLGLGVTAAADAALDDTWLPALRSRQEGRVAGVSFDWRAENRMLGWLKLAPVEQPQRFNAQVLVSRHLQRPYEPAWSQTSWYDPTGNPDVSYPTWEAGRVAYNPADHFAITDERQVAAIASLARLRANGRATLSLGWLRTRTVTSVSGARGEDLRWQRYRFSADSFHIDRGDYPLYRESGSDVFTLRGDAEAARRGGSGIRAGAGVTYEEVSLYERDHAAYYILVDSIRTYHAFAPGGFGYVQGRWEAGGLVLNTGLRAEYFTPGPQGKEQTLPWEGRGTLTLSPRFGFAYPISVRDALSLAYARIHQAPARDYLYDRRRVPNTREPLGNPALQPATVASYEAALKHTFDPQWALQLSTFYRDVYGQVGARNRARRGWPTKLCYVSDDDGHVAGFELSVLHACGERRRLEAHYTFMQAWGLESRPEGDPYGAPLDVRVPPTGATQLSWDRRHTIQLNGIWPPGEGWVLSWSTTVGSPLPWTPKPRREVFVELPLVNSRRLGWTENTNVDVEWTPPFAHGFRIGLEIRNLWDFRGAKAVTVDGYPNPTINTRYDDYGAYRTETGQGGGAYWIWTGADSGYWVPVHDARLDIPPRTLRLSVGASW